MPPNFVWNAVRCGRQINCENAGPEIPQPASESESQAFDNAEDTAIGSAVPLSQNEKESADQKQELPVSEEPPNDELVEDEEEKDASPDASRVTLLKDVITKFAFVSCNRCLLNSHKLTVAVFLTLRIMASLPELLKPPCFIWSTIPCSLPCRNCVGPS